MGLVENSSDNIFKCPLIASKLKLFLFGCLNLSLDKSIAFFLVNGADDGRGKGMGRGNCQNDVGRFDIGPERAGKSIFVACGSVGQG